MTDDKRFTTVEVPKPTQWGIWYDGAYLSTYQVCTLLNEYVDVRKENEQLKIIRSDLASELDIVQNELNIAIYNGFAPSFAYKKYMASKKTEYDKFWENKIKTHNNRLNGVRE